MKHLSNWIEIPVTDMNRAKSFYASILGGIELHEMALGPVKYALFPCEDRYNCGALAEGEHYQPGADGPLVYLDGGADLDAILQRVQNAGGTVALAKTYLSPEAGYIGMFIDTEGNRIGLQNPSHD